MCIGCSTEEVKPVVSDVHLQVSIDTYFSANENGQGYVDYDALEYQFVFEPYRLSSDQEDYARIVVWQNRTLKNDYFQKALGVSYIDGFYLESEMPLQSRKEITISVYDVYDECDVDFFTKEIIEGYIATIQEVKYSIYVGNRLIETNTIVINKEE